MRKNGKKPASTLMAERAEEEARKAQTAEMLGPQTELPGPSDGPTGEQVAAAIQERLSNGPLSFGDLVLWTRQKWGFSTEVAYGLVLGEIDLGNVRHEEGSAKCYTVASLEALAPPVLEDGEQPLTAVSTVLDEAIGATAGTEAAKHVDSAIQGLIDRGAICGEVRDGETWLSLPVSVPEAIASVAETRPDLVENAGTPESDAKEAHADARDLRQDSKKLVSVMDKLRRRKSLKDQIAGLKEELKELTDEMKGIDAELDGIGREGDKAIETAPKVEPKPATTEPQDVALPFGDPVIVEDDGEHATVGTAALVP